MKLIARILTLAMLVLPAGAFAQPAAVPGLAAADPCPPVEADFAKDTAAFTEAVLTPGKVLNIAEIIKTMPPETLAKMGAMQKAALDRQAKDWPFLCRYAAENAAVLESGIRPRVVFLGDSITENWKQGAPALFGPQTLDRGISGQTTPQILLRFYQDVVALRPRAVHIMAGVNDIMGNTGPTSDATIVNNIRAMIDLAKANRIRVVLAAIAPSKAFVAKPDMNLVPRIAAVNQLLADLARHKHVEFVDYAPVLANAQGGLKDALGNDGLHPNRDGYALMRPLTERAIARAAK